MKNNKNFSPNSSAFSIIELAVVLTIITVLMAGVMTGQKVIYATKIATARSLTANSPVKDIEDVIFWLEATSKDSFDEDEGIDGVSVSTWYDINPRSTNQYDVTQATSDNQPTYNENAFNNLPALTFDGDDYLSNTSFPEISVITIFAVGEYQSGDIQQGMVEISNGIVNSGVLLFYNQTLESIFRINSSGTKDAKLTESLPAKHIFTGIADGTNSTYFVDGNEKGTIAAGNISNDLGQLFIGRLSNFSAFSLVGTLGEVIIYDRALLPYERKAVEEYLSKKWGIDLE